MTLAASDWAAIVGYLLITLILGLYFRGRSGKSTEDYFVSGRNVSWWLAGTSMVATTFAADTPLVVTGLVYANGVAGNWLWWSFLPSGMMTVFLFARLWRRSGLITDVQFAEMRYSGKPAAFLRGFRAVYLGLLMNCLILGWVTKAMVNIISTSMGISDFKALLICVFFLMPFTGIYVSLGGLWGVLWTDLFQFVLKMAIVISVAWYGVRAVGGMPQLLAKLAERRAALGSGASDITALLPDFSRGLTGEALWTLPVITFAVHLAVQWWAFWYPGAEPGGGGYIAQRIFSAKDERNGLLSVLWFNLAHYALRPWPWILTALVAVILYPNLAQPERGFMLVAIHQTPHALLGILLAGFMAAFMSTVATQLNWGSSYLIEDFYRRFLKKEGSELHFVNASRLATAFLVLAAAAVAWQLTSVSAGWKIVLELGAGTGGVYLLRWYWWRVNAWSEISAMLAAMITTLMLHSSALWNALIGRPQPFSGSDPVIFAKTTLCTTGITTLVWVAVTLFTAAEPNDTLVRFYTKVRPQITGWQPVAKLAGEVPVTHDLGRNLLSWILGCVLIYSALFSIGKLCFGFYLEGLLLAVLAIASALVISRLMPKPAEWPCSSRWVPRLDPRRVRFLHRSFSLRYACSPVRRNQERNRSHHNRDARHAACRGAAIRPACGPLRAAHSADGQRNLFFHHRGFVRFFSQLHGLYFPARAVWNRNGRRMGCWRVAGDGSCAGALARNPQWNPAEWLFDRISAGGDGRTVSLTRVGVASPVLDRRAARATRALHPDESAGIRGVEAAPRCEHRASFAYRGGRVEALRLSRCAHDLHDVPISRNAGSLSGLSERSAQDFQRNGSQYRDDL